MIRCYRCGRQPGQLMEYAEQAAMQPDDFPTAEDFVRTEEGTFNRDDETFCCTECYVEIGMPTTVWGWVAPPLLPPERRVQKEPELE